MPILRPATALRAAKTLSTSGSSSGTKATHATAITARRFSTTPRSLAADHHAHEDQYDPPGGWLWGIKPGEKPEKEGWETVFFWGFYGGLGLAVVAYAFKPDTSIQTWALEEARRRLEVEGILKEPDSEE